MAIGMTRPRQDSPASGEQAPLDLREPELGLVGGDHEIASEQELEASADGGGVRGADDRLRASAPQEPHVRGSGVGIARSAACRR